jgi:hypothetical protein
VTEPAPTEPRLRIVSGDPTPEEIAALTAVLLARGDNAPAGTEAPSQWRSRARNVRPPLTAGPGAWRASGLPR